MKRTKRLLQILLAVVLCTALAACGSGSEETEEKNTANTEAIAGDYYLDLSELGMKLTVYLRISEDGNFLFSNTTDFEMNKSSGTVEEGKGNYIMVYESVNGEEKKLSEGVTSSFLINEDGSLDFSGCERIYYGSATAITVSADDAAITLTAVPLPEDYQEQSTESEFTAGTYKAEHEGTIYLLSCYEDTSYLLLTIQGEQGAETYTSESGIYGVSTTQLALTPAGLSRLSGEILSATQLNVPVLTGAGEERTEVAFTKMEAPQMLAAFSGQTEDGTVAVVTLFDDYTYTSEAAGFSESGILVPDSETGSFKIYPDHPETGVRGMNQISTVPAGTFAIADGKMSLTDFRMRTSESLTRAKGTVTQN